MNTISKAQFARDCGVSKPAISKAVNEGRVIVDDKGKVNLDDPHTKSFIQTQRDKKKPPSKKPTKEKNKKLSQIKLAKNELTEKENDEVKDPGEQIEMNFLSLDEITPENIRFVTKRHIDILDKFEKAIQTKQNREEKRQLLISRIRVRQIFAKLYSIDTNQFKTMEDRLVPEACGIFGFQDDSSEAVSLRKLINNDCAKTLRHIKRLLDEFLIATESEPI